MYKDHDTEVEAKETFESYSKSLEGFCPVIFNLCRTNCLCLVKGSVFEVKYHVGSKWRSSSCYCSHPFISGNLNINQ